MMAQAQSTAPKGKELTGRKVLAITVGFFAVIISVNLYMAYMAVSTFPGLEVKNSYVASQEFDRNRTAQIALNWNVTSEIKGQDLHLSILGADNAPVTPASIEATFGRATHMRDDQTPIFTQQDDGSFIAPVGELDGGNWNLRLKAHAADGTLFQQRIVIYLSGI